MPTFTPQAPSKLQAALKDNKPIVSNLSEIRNYSAAISTTSSFLYDPIGYPIKSTQQLNVDWSKFENHTFFSSAEAKVGLAFDQIINGYPFDGSREEVEKFHENLTGFDKWVLDKFPKFRGQLHFSDSWIEVKDRTGALYPDLSKKDSGSAILNPPISSSLSIEFHLHVPQNSAGQQVICQKSSGETQGFGIYLDGDTSPTHAQINFIVTSGSQYLKVSASVEKDEFSHVCAIWNRESENNFAEIYVNEKKIEKSTSECFINKLDIDANSFLIGTGSTVTYGSDQFIPTDTLSGSLDELRVFHAVRTKKQIESFGKKSIYATPDLKLYYRFNEPPPPLTPTLSDAVNAIVLDSSGNSLHSTVVNFASNLRQDASADVKNRLVFEKPSSCPVLFPAYESVSLLSEDLMLSASSYDKENPNLIIKLIPSHYLAEGAEYEGKILPRDADHIGSYGGDGIPGQGKITSAQIIMSFLYIWARFFDEIKLHVQTFGNLNFIDYEKTDNIPDNFLDRMVKSYGFYLPPLFNKGTMDQYVNAENASEDLANIETSLRDVQKEIMRRVLINMPEVIKSKGTQHSIKSFLRSVGIDPDNSFKIREFGGPTTKHISSAREKKSEPNVMLQMSKDSLVLSPFLSASRKEPGYPQIAGTLSSDGTSDNPSDGLLTSGSWTVEAIYKFNEINLASLNSVTQSLMRICTGDFSNENPWTDQPELDNSSIVANLIAINDASSGVTHLRLHTRPGNGVASPVLTMQLDLNNSGIFDGDRWNISFGCLRNDAQDSNVSSSYFLKVATNQEGSAQQFQTTSSFFQEVTGAEINCLREKITPQMNNFLAIGNDQLIVPGDFLNYYSGAPDDASATNFDGMISNLRFWSKALTNEEFIEHVRNYKSTGVENPLLNYNFVTSESGSFEKLRLNAITKQEEKFANSLGESTFLDFSQNNMHLSGSGFTPETRVLIGDVFEYSYLSPKFDESASDEKIRIRGYQNQSLIDANPWSSTAPVHEIVASERPQDDVRMSIEFSLVDALNRDIITLMSSFDFMENAIGSPELIYSPDYPDLDRLREIYFKRIGDKINFQGFFEFFRWFEQSLGRFIEQLVPRKTQFKGTNYVIESHMLERNKLEYQVPEIYLAENDRGRIRDVLLLQQISGNVRRY
jgi:hypothetical protein